MWKKVIFILIIIFLVVWQKSFLSTFTTANLFLALIIILALENKPLSVTGAVIGGIIMDLYSPIILGLTPLLLILILLGLKIMIENFFSPRFLPSYLLLGAGGVLFFYVLLTISLQILFAIGVSEINTNFNLLILTKKIVSTEICFLILAMSYKLFLRKITPRWSLYDIK